MQKDPLAIVAAWKAKGRDVWERLPGETPMGFEAFKHFRELGTGRSLTKLVEAHGHSINSVKGWSKNWAWQVRARAWDDEQDRLRDVWLQNERKKAVERHVRISQALSSKALQALASLDPTKMNATEVIRWAEVSVKMEREALGFKDRLEISVTPSEAIETMSPQETQARMMVLQKELERRIADAEQSADIVDAELVEDEEP